MNTSLIGKRALVCGASKGIGRATALALASLGAEVVALSRSRNLLETLCEELPSDNGQKHSFVIADQDDRPDLRKKINNLLSRFSIQILINNSGGPPAGAIFEATADAFMTAMQRHLLVNHLLVQALVPGMKESGYGRIINIISISVKEPITNLGVSNTTRAAVAGWAKTLAGELGAEGITVNNVLPGYTKTERLNELFDGIAAKRNIQRAELDATIAATIPLRRFATAAEVGEVAAFLASPAAGYISGVSLPVDGGRIRSI